MNFFSSFSRARYCSILSLLFMGMPPFYLIYELIFIYFYGLVFLLSLDLVVLSLMVLFWRRTSGVGDYVSSSVLFVFCDSGSNYFSGFWLANACLIASVGALAPVGIDS